MKTFKLTKIVGLLLWCTTLVQSQDQTDTTTLERQLDEVMILSTRLPSSQLRSSQSVHRRDLSSDNIHNQHLTMDESLWYLPGVFAINSLNFSQDLRVSMRGFGSRSAFGVRGIKILLDGIPATTPDGQSQLDHFDPSQLSSVELLSGAGSSLYGNASGGVLDFRTRRHESSTIGGGVSIGSYGLTKFNLLGAKVSEEATWQGNVSYVGYKGYRAHSEAQTLVANGSYFRSIKDGEIALRLNLTHSPKAQDPGGINLEQVSEDRRSARDRNVLFDGGEEITRGSVSASFEKQINGSQKLDLNAYYLFRDFNNRLPFENGGQVAFFRNYMGAQARYHMLGEKSRTLFGLDLEHQADLRHRYNNLEGSRGAETLDQLEEFTLLGLYVRQEFDLSSAWLLEATARLDVMRLAVDDRFDTDGDQSGSTNLNHLSPSIGLNYAWRPSQHLFARFGHSFETPSLSELSNNPSGLGGFNNDLLPQKANHFELGSKGRTKQWKYEAAVFFIDVENELIPFELADFPGRTFYRNSGSSSRTGLEFSFGGRITRSLSVNLAYTYSDFKFVDFEIDGSDLEGNQVPGIPQHFANAGWQFNTQGGFFSGLDFNYVGALFANNSNLVEVENYLLTHFRVGQTWKKKGGASILLSGGIRNLLGVEYFDNIRLNAFGSRFYEAGPQAQIYVSAQFEM